MSNIEIQNSINYWNNLHKNYQLSDIKVDDWLDKFEDIILVAR